MKTKITDKKTYYVSDTNVTAYSHPTLEHIKKFHGIPKEEQLIDVITDKLVIIHQYPQVYKKITPPTQNKISDNSCHITMSVFPNHLIAQIANITQSQCKNPQLQYLEYKVNRFVLDNNNEFVLNYIGFSHYF